MQTSENRREKAFPSGFDLPNYLKSQAARVDSVLRNVMPAATARPEILHRAMRHAVLGGGKRLRPILCLTACEALGGGRDAALLPAAAIEVLHAYTLVHDDLPSMDDDCERRGQPTVHVAFGEANAILAGDALQTLAFELLARTAPTPRWQPHHFVLELASAAGAAGVVGGQVDDLAGVGQADAEMIRRIHERKTAVLFRAALRMGAMAANAPSAQCSALGAYGLSLGMAFQMTDDLLDDAASTGAPTQETTCLAVSSREQARAQAARHIDTALRQLAQVFSPPAPPLTALARFVLTRGH